MKTFLRLLAAAIVLPTALHAADAVPQNTPLTPADIPCPLEHAEVGDWASYRLPDGTPFNIAVVQKYVENGETVVHILTEKGTGRTAKSSTQRVYVSDYVRDARTLGPDQSADRAEILVKRRKVRAVMITTWDDKHAIMRRYYSDRVPVWGLVRGAEYDATNREQAMELVDFGWALSDDDTLETPER